MCVYTTISTSFCSYINFWWNYTSYAQDVFLEDVEGDGLAGEAVKELQAPAAVVAQLLAVGADLERDELKNVLLSELF